MESDKKCIRHCLLFSKKSAADAHKIICETYNENIITIRTCEKWLKRFKNSDFNSNNKERFERPAVEEDELWKNGKKLW